MDGIQGTRAKLYLALANLVALGNVCMHLPKEKGKPPRIYNVAQANTSSAVQAQGT